MQVKQFPASERGLKSTDWLKSNFFFSFGEFRNPTLDAFGSLVAFNDDFVKEGQGFGLHQHMNMEIISIMLKGSMSHKDNLGYHNTVHENYVQIMSAGSGIRHEEYNVGNEEVNFLQIWIKPKLQNISPRYQWRHFPKEGRINRLQTIVSNEEGYHHCWINQNAKLSLGHFERGEEVTYSFNPANKCLFIFNCEGLLSINDINIGKRDGMGIWDTDTVIIKNMEASQFLIIETPINQK